MRLPEIVRVGRCGDLTVVITPDIEWPGYPAVPGAEAWALVDDTGRIAVIADKVHPLDLADDIDVMLADEFRGVYNPRTGYTSRGVEIEARAWFDRAAVWQEANRP